jgi:hypothetical protein
MKTNCLYRALLFCVVTALISLNSKAQLNKGTWLIGGSGSFSSTTNTFNSASVNFNSDVTEINITPNVGYFLLDKFPAGLKTSYTVSRTKEFQGAYGNQQRFEIGPFARYYFLDKEKIFNILTDASYQFGFANLTGVHGNINTMTLMAGPALYFNSSVGLEFLFGYSNRRERFDGIDSQQKGLKVSLGFQFHLEKR